MIASDPNRTVIPGFLVTAVVECPLGGILHQCRAITREMTLSFSNITRKPRRSADFEAWERHWVSGVADRSEYAKQLGLARVEELGVKQHAYAAQTDYGY